ncbi:hypothetical protein AB7M35_003191 [Amorphus suaedae]
MSGMEADFASRIGQMLDAVAADDRTVAFWWRDDDAVVPSPALDRLLTLADAHAVPLALAVIAAGAERALGDRLEPTGDVVVLQHGWAHANHAAEGEKPTELGNDRPIGTVLDDLSRGHQRLSRMFGSRFLPVVVPPWNRIADDVAARRVEAGLPGLSCFKSLETADHRLDTHVDPIGWRGDRGFVGWQAAADAIAAEIDRRAESPTPIGILTHHLVQDEATWSFLDAFLGVAAAHPAARWPHPADAFGFGQG